MGDWGEGFVEVNAMGLSETVSNKVSLVVLYGAIFSHFDVPYPFAGYNLFSLWLRYGCPCFVILK